ncbi:MAG: hypothetical protein ACREXR_02510 [Gammaproteobacteria bacterium]
MPYQELPLPNGTPPQIADMVREQLDPLLADVHAMLRLPIEGQPGLEAGCNLSATLVLLEVVGGICVELYDDPSLSNPDRRVQRSECFKRTVEKHFPWKHEQHLPGAITGRHAAELLYGAFRNPLAHHLGTYDGPYLGNIKVAKGPLSDQQIEAIEKSETRPKDWIRPTLATDAETKEGRTKTVLTVKCLYWGVRRMIRCLLEERVNNAAQGATNTGRAYLEATATAGPVTSGAIPYVSVSTIDGLPKKE